MATINHPRIPPATTGGTWSQMFPDYHARLVAMAYLIAHTEAPSWQLAK